MTPKSRMFVKKLNRISFVDVGACGGLPGQGGADIAIMKRRDLAQKGAGAPATFADIRDNMKVDRALSQMWEFQDRFYESIRSITHSDLPDDEKGDMIDKSLKEYLQFLSDAVPKWADGKEIEKRGGPMDPKKTEKAVDLDKLDTDALKRVAAEAIEKNAKLEADNAKISERVTALEAAEKRAKPDDQGDEGDLDLTDESAFKRACKGQPEPVVRVLTATRKQALDAKAQAEAATKRSEESEKRFTEERDARELGTLTTKARKDMGGLSIKPDDLGAILQTAKRAMPDQYGELERVLRAASEQVAKSGITRALGEDNLGDDDGEGAATDTVFKRAYKLVAEKKADNIGDAMSQVFAADPQLREQYERESSVRA